MAKIIQTRVEANGDIHLGFSGFVGRDCQTEEERLRRELASLGLNVSVRLAPRESEGPPAASQQHGAMRKNVQ